MLYICHRNDLLKFDYRDMKISCFVYDCLCLKFKQVFYYRGKIMGLVYALQLFVQVN